MNQELAKTNNIDKSDAISNFIASAASCATIFRTQDNKALRVSLGDLFDAMEFALTHAPNTCFLLLNVRDKKQSYLTNLIIKTALITQVLSHQGNYCSSTRKKLISASLLIIYAMAPYFLKVKTDANLFAQYKGIFMSAAKITFKHVKNEYIDQPDILRILSQIANINEFKSKNQLCQTIVIVSVNSAVYACPFLLSKPLTADTALAKSLTQPSIVCSKHFTESYAGIFEPCISILSYGKLCVSADNQFLLCVDHKVISKHQIAEVPCISYEKVEERNTLVSLLVSSTNKVRFVIPQHAINFEVAFNLLSVDAIENFAGIKLNNSETNARYSPPDYLDKTSTALLSETTMLIADYLSEDIHKSKLVMDYAKGVTRTQQPISNIRHAIALLGMIRIYPVVCISEMKVLQQTNLSFGEYEVINKENVFAKIANELSKVANFAIPEYQELVARLLFQGLMLIPKSRYSASIATLLGPNENDLHTLNDALGKAKLENWWRCSKKLALDWKLPKVYVATLNSFFEVKSKNVEFNLVPKQIRENVSGLIIAEWILLNWLKGNSRPVTLTNISNALSVLGISNSEFLTVYQKLLDTGQPFSSLR